MKSATSPYQPCREVEDQREELSFDGVIEEADYACLLPLRFMTDNASTDMDPRIWLLHRQ